MKEITISWYRFNKDEPSSKHLRRVVKDRHVDIATKDMLLLAAREGVTIPPKRVLIRPFN